VLLDDIADYLSSGGMGTVGSALFKGYMPEAPDDAIAVYETGGGFPIHAMNGSAGQAKVERPRVQVVVRSAEDEYAVARQRAHNIFVLLDGLPDRDINGTRYKWGQAVQSPFMLGRDSQRRPLIACNYDLIKALSTSTST
jgi:hypothetical protein